MNLLNLDEFIYYFLLMLSAIVYSASFFYGIKRFYPIALCLIIGVICEILTKLIVYDLITIFGKKNNALIGHLYTWSSFLLFAIFLYVRIDKTLFKTLFKILICLSVVIGILTQLSIKPYLFTPDPWLVFPLMITILIMSITSLFELLSKNKGYPYITIGIFLSSGSYLISHSVAGTYVNVDLEVWYFRESLNRIVLIFMYLLFLLEWFVTFKVLRNRFKKIS